MNNETLVRELRNAADEWSSNHPIVHTFETQYGVALREAANAIEELQMMLDGVSSASQQKSGITVPLPPHGRLIDADEAKQEIIDLIDEYSWLDENGLHNPKWCAMMEALSVIEQAPTILEAENAE